MGKQWVYTTSKQQNNKTKSQKSQILAMGVYNIHQNPKFLRFHAFPTCFKYASCSYLVLEASAQLKNLRKDRETSVARVLRISQTAGQG